MKYEKPIKPSDKFVIDNHYSLDCVCDILRYHPVFAGDTQSCAEFRPVASKKNIFWILKIQIHTWYLKVPFSCLSDGTNHKSFGMQKIWIYIKKFFPQWGKPLLPAVRRCRGNMFALCQLPSRTKTSKTNWSVHM